MPKDKAAKYKGPQDLKGLKVGVTAPGSSTNMFVNNMLAKGGLKPTDVSIVGVGTGSGAFAAMDKGEIDAISNLDPVITQLESTGKFVAVADSRTEKGMKDIYGGDYHGLGDLHHRRVHQEEPEHRAGRGERDGARRPLDREGHAAGDRRPHARRVQGRQSRRSTRRRC